jgi:hypothetical protein
MLVDSQAQLNSLGAAPGEEAPPAPDPALDMTADEQAALGSYLTAVAAATEALADDDLAAYNVALVKIPASPKGLTAAAPAAAGDLTSARRSFLPLSQSVADYARGARAHFPKLKIFRCPMSEQVGGGAPENAKWIQFTPTLRNPYMGQEMLRCGVAVP